MVLSLILPCYNPPQGWERNIYEGYTGFCGRINATAELIIVLDGIGHNDTDEGLRYLQQNIPGLKLISYPENKGKGHAIRQGVAQATGDIIIYTDIDLPYTQQSMFTIFDDLSSGVCDVAIGVKDDAYYAHVPYLRKLISRFLRSMTSVFLSLPVTDTQCGLKGFKASVKPVFLQTTIDRYLFDLEFVRNCYKNKAFRIKPIPVTLNDKVHFRKMSYSILLPEMLNFVTLLFKKPHG